MDAVYKAPQIARGLLGWIEGPLERLLQSADLDAISSQFLHGLGREPPVVQLAVHDP